MGWFYHGRTYPTPQGAERARAEDRNRLRALRTGLKSVEALAQRREAAATTQRAELADKIVLALVDEISAAIVRPGPKPEERECYVMAQELRDHSPNLRDLVVRILRVEEEERT